MSTAHQARKQQHSEEETWTQSTTHGHPRVTGDLFTVSSPPPLGRVSWRTPVPLSGLGHHRGSGGAELKWTRKPQVCESLAVTRGEDAELQAGIPDKHMWQSLTLGTRALTGQRPQQTVTCLRSRIPSQQLHGKHEPVMDILKWKHQTLTLESESLGLETRLGHTRSSMVVDEGPHHERARLIRQGCEVWLNNCFFPGETHTAFNFFLCY